MSDSAAAGSVQPDAAAAGNLASAQTPPDNGSAGADAKWWLEGLSGDNLKLAESKGWKEPGDIDKVLTSYAELEKLSGKSVQVPAEDAKPEEWDAYLSKLPPTMRAPESADKYEFKLPEGLPPDLPYDDTLASTSKEFMHKAKLNPSQAQAVHDGFVSYVAEQHKAAMVQLSEDVEASAEIAVKKWGPTEGADYKKNYEIVNATVKKFGLVDVLKKANILLPDNALNDPTGQLVEFFLAVGKDAKIGVLEDTIDTTGKPDLGPNPFVKDAKGHRNLTAISKLVKRDPDRAKRLCQEAGEKWSAWAPSNPR